MNKYDWKNAFPKPSENFHNKLCMTLDSFEKENLKADITEKISMLTKKTEQKKSINRLWLIMKKTVTKLC